ncbi:uncharacterized protein EV154DRAFT_479011 [Mucor mucedo]|uniref:uncharacterized protein n=1 Tax=Mucor mucedo TaxID=29922 RepID=UPI00221E76D3|nr:uncharacterized protein EV154DRAFT_479011 [Mucor mucedo]KAI7893713.1 hypothetical protein EV154DRAFT_479011 [Mucor mucedo]
MNTPIDYFFQTSPKEWNVLEALSIYDKLERCDSFGSLLQTMRREVDSVCERQPTFKKKGKSFADTIEEGIKIHAFVLLLEFSNCNLHGDTTVASKNEGQHPDHNNTGADTQPPTKICIDTITNHGEFNIANNKQRLLPSLDNTNNAYVTPITPTVIIRV